MSGMHWHFTALALWPGAARWGSVTYLESGHFALTASRMRSLAGGVAARGVRARSGADAARVGRCGRAGSDRYVSASSVVVTGGFRLGMMSARPAWPEHRERAFSLRHEFPTFEPARQRERGATHPRCAQRRHSAHHVAIAQVQVHVVWPHDDELVGDCLASLGRGVGHGWRKRSGEGGEAACGAA